MAVYEGARPRSSLLPRRQPRLDAPALPRRRIRGAVRANRRASRTSLILGGIVVALSIDEGLTQLGEPLVLPGR